METSLVLGLILLNIILLVVLGFFGFLIYRMLRDRQIKIDQSAEPSPPLHATSHYHPEIQKRLEEVTFTNPVREDIFCPYHPQEPGEVQCGMCARYFCSKCVRPMKSIYFCKEHMALYLRSQWQEVLTLKTNSDDAEAGVRLYEQKQQLFNEEQIPTYIETHYKIDVDGDSIETYLVLFAQEVQHSQVKEYFQEFIQA